MVELITYLAQNLVSRPDQVEVFETVGDGPVIITLKVAPEDINVVIGRHGRTARAMRSLLAAAAAKKGRRCHLEIFKYEDQSVLEEDDEDA